MSENSKTKDIWDKADVIGKLLIPIVIAGATWWFDSSRQEGEAKQKTLAVVIDILRTPKSAETENLRKWALGVFEKETGIASAKLTSGAREELEQGIQLPSASQLRLPNPGQLLRVSIIRLEKTAADKSERIKSDLIAAGYTNIEVSERPKTTFPNKAEVRFYYPADSQNAKSLRDYIKNNLGIPIEINDRSQDKDVSSHRPGDLHIYVNI